MYSVGKGEDEEVAPPTTVVEVGSVAIDSVANTSFDGSDGGTGTLKRKTPPSSFVFKAR